MLTLNPCVGTQILAQQLAACAQPIDIGIRRDTASGDVRWTPNGAWDIKADYSHMDRKGTQVGSGFGGIAVTSQFAKPVDDTTQNYGLNAEHVGTSPWGQKLIFKAGYTGSTFTENLAGDFFTVQSSNPTQPFGARFATWPSNRADGVTSQVLADLPWKTRYVGNFNYTMMRQNDSFFANNTDPTRVTTPPATSLNGAINTLLLNNVVTTKLTSELTNKLAYRYYNFQNNTPEILFNGVFNRDATTSSEVVNSLSIVAAPCMARARRRTTTIKVMSASSSGTARRRRIRVAMRPSFTRRRIAN